MDLVEKYQSALVLAAIAVGLAVGQIDGVASVADRLILPFLMVMLFAAFVGIPLSHLREAFGNRRVVGSSLLVNFVWSPLLAVGLGAVFLRDQPALWVGLIMLLVTPCTDWYLVFTDIADGDVPLATSVLPYNLVLQLVLLPVYLYAFAGTLVDLPLALLVESVLLVLVVPLIFGGIARWGLSPDEGRDVVQRAIPAATEPDPDRLPRAGHRSDVRVARRGGRREPRLLALLAVPVVLFYAINLAVGFAAGRLLSFSYGEMVCFNNTILSRNSPPRSRSPSSRSPTSR